MLIVVPEFDPSLLYYALGYLERHRRHGEIVTGLLFIDQNVPDMHEQSRTVVTPMKDMEFEHLNPGSEALAELQKGKK